MIVTRCHCTVVMIVSVYCCNDIDPVSAQGLAEMVKLTCT